MAVVSQQSAGALMQALDRRLADGATSIHLLLSSPGGSVFHGLSVHNFMRGLSVPIATYNFGSVDSIGVVMFCAGSRRYCVPHSRFHIHGVRANFKGEASFDEQALEERIKLLKTDYTNIARVISATTGRNENQVVRDMNKQTSLMPEQAVKYGLVHEVKPQLLPASAALTVIYEDASLAEFKAPEQQLPLPEHVTGEEGGETGAVVETFTVSPEATTAISP